jgi:hypothetical protein
MADPFQSLLRFDDSLTLCIEGLNDTCTFPCTIHPPDADASVLVTLEDKRKAGVEAFFQKGKVSTNCLQLRFNVLLLPGGNLKLFPKR